MSTWRALRKLLEARYPGYAEILNPPATEAEIARLEAHFGVALPDAVREIYEDANGQSTRVPGVFVGMTMLPIEYIINEALEWASVDNDDFPPSGFSSAPPGAIQLMYTNPRWIPLFNTGGGNHVGLDFDPGPQGTPGQVINFGRDEDDKTVLAKSMEHFLLDCIKRLQTDPKLEIDAQGIASYDGNMVIDCWVYEKYQAQK